MSDLVPRLSASRRIAQTKWTVIRANITEACHESTDPLRWLRGWRDSFNRPTVLTLLDLRSQITKADSAWIRDFLEQNGVVRLLRVFQSLVDQNSLNFQDTLLQLSCVGCIKAVMNSKTGLEYFIENEEVVEKFAFALHNCESSVKKQIFELLSSLCVYSDDGHKRVLQILQAFKETYKKPHRFSLVVDELRQSENHAYKSSLLALTNCVINGEKLLEQRVRVRNEFLGLQLSPLLEGLRNGEQDTELGIQVDVFDEKRSSDDELLPGPEGVDLTSHQEIFDAIYEQVSCTNYEFPFLAILQHLLQLATNEHQNSEPLWETVEKLVFRAALLTKADDPNNLLYSGGKRLERATCTCKCGHEDGTNEARKRRMSMLPLTLQTSVSFPGIFTPTIVDIDIDSVDGRIREPVAPQDNGAPSLPSVGAPPPPPPPMFSAPGAPPPPLGGVPPPPPIGGGPPPPPPLNGFSPVHSLPQPELPPVPIPKSKMRTLQWGKIAPQKLVGKSCVWSGLAKLGSKHDIDFDRMSELFALTTKRPGNSGTDKVDSPEKKKKEEILLVDGKRSLNINIYLRQFRLSVEELMVMINEGQSENIGVERLMGLMKLLPESDELEMLRSFDGDRNKLGSAEKFLMRLIDISEYKLRIEGMLLKEEFDQKMEYIKPAIDSVMLTTKDLMESEEIREIFLMILMTGNFINSGSYAGNAAGFKFSALLKLSEVRANVPRMNLLHYLVMELENNRPDLLGFHEKMTSLDEASQCSIDGINADIKSLMQRTENLSSQIDNLSGGFRDKMSEFLNFAKSELSELELDMTEVEEQRKQMSEYLCEDEKQFSLEECFKTFAQFCQKFRKAIEENNVRKLHEDKMAKKKKQREDENGRKRPDRGRLNSSSEDSRIIDRLLGNIKSGFISGDTESECGSRRTSQEDLDLATPFKRHTWTRSSDERPSRPHSDEIQRSLDDQDPRRRRVASEDVNLMEYLANAGEERKWESVLERSASASRRRRGRRDDVIIERERDAITTEKKSHRRANSDVGTLGSDLARPGSVGSDLARPGSDAADEELGIDRKVCLRDSGIDSPNTTSRPTSMESPIPESLEQEKLSFRNKRRQERAKRASSPESSLPGPTVLTTEPLPQTTPPSTSQQQQLPSDTGTSAIKVPSESGTAVTNGDRRQLSITKKTDIDQLMQDIEDTRRKKEAEKPKVLLPTKTDRPIEVKTLHSYSDTAVSDKTLLLVDQPSPGHETSNVQNRFKLRWKSFLRQRSNEDELKSPNHLEPAKSLTGSESPTSPTSPVPRRKSRRWLQQLATRYNEDEGTQTPPPVPPHLPTTPSNQPPVPPHQPTFPRPTITVSPDQTMAVVHEEKVDRPTSLTLTLPRGQDRLEQNHGLTEEKEKWVKSMEFLRTPEEGERVSSPNSRPSSPQPDRKHEPVNLSLSTEELHANDTSSLTETKSMTSLTPPSDSGLSKLNRMLAKLPIKRRSLGIKRSRSNADMDSLDKMKNIRNRSESQTVMRNDNGTSDALELIAGPPSNVAASSPVLNRLTVNSDDKENEVETPKLKSKFGKLSRKLSERSKVGVVVKSEDVAIDNSLVSSESDRTEVGKTVPSVTRSPAEGSMPGTSKTNQVARLTDMSSPQVGRGNSDATGRDSAATPGSPAATSRGPAVPARGSAAAPRNPAVPARGSAAPPISPAVPVRGSAASPISPAVPLRGSAASARSPAVPARGSAARSSAVIGRTPRTPSVQSNLAKRSTSAIGRLQDEPRRRSSADSITSSASTTSQRTMTSTTARARSTVSTASKTPEPARYSTVRPSSSIVSRKSVSNTATHSDRNVDSKTSARLIVARASSTHPRSQSATPRLSLTGTKSPAASPRSSVTSTTSPASTRLSNSTNGAMRAARTTRSSDTTTRATARATTGVSKPASTINVPSPGMRPAVSSNRIAAKPAAHAQTALIRTVPAVPKRAIPATSTTARLASPRTAKNNGPISKATNDTTTSSRITRSDSSDSGVFDRLSTFDRNSKLRASFRAESASARVRPASVVPARASVRSRPGTAMS